MDLGPIKRIINMTSKTAVEGLVMMEATFTPIFPVDFFNKRPLLSCHK